MSEPNHPRSTSYRWVVTLAVLFGLFTLWPLSAGPFIWLQVNGHVEPATAEWIESTVYRPWDWLYNSNETAEAFFDWYIPLWEGSP